MVAGEAEKRTRWHRLLGTLLEEVLNPVGIMVHTDFPIMSEPPKADVLLLRNEKNEWTREQKACLPDGIRDCGARHILLEFKYTESVNKKAFLQTICYGHLFRRTSNLSEGEVRTFLISSKTPNNKTLARYGYTASNPSGVLRSDNIMLRHIPLISLNDLALKPHNAFFKVFASRIREKHASFDSLMKNKSVSTNPGIFWFVKGLAAHWFYYKGGSMENELTPEKLRKIGKRFEDIIISNIPFEDILGKYGKDTILANFKLEDILAKYGKDTILANFELEDIFAIYGKDTILANFELEDIFAIYGKDTILANFELEDILAKYGKDTILANFELEDIFAKYGKKTILESYSEEELEAYLRELRKRKRH